MDIPASQGLKFAFADSNSASPFSIFPTMQGVSRFLHILLLQTVIIIAHPHCKITFLPVSNVDPKLSLFLPILP